VGVSTSKETDILHSRLFSTLGTVAWLFFTNASFAEELNTTAGASTAEASQTATTESVGDPLTDKDSAAALPTRRADPGGSNEWRRNDNAGEAARGSSTRSSRGNSDSSEGGGGGGGDVD
jgi:hypothetical protein